MDTMNRKMEGESEEPQFRVAAVVPSAGCGQRMGERTPKQYLQVCGRPLILHCLTSLEAIHWVENIIVVADDPSRMSEVIQNEGLSRTKVVKGLSTRHRSIRAGVEQLGQGTPPDVVIVHDGVRPLIPMPILTKVVQAAWTHGASGAVRALVSTVVKPDEEGLLEESLFRSDYRNSEMPQAFRYSVIREAYERCSEEELEHGTECLALALKYCGTRAKLISGPPQLWKVTDEKDLALARILLPKYTRRILVICQALPSTLPKSGPKRKLDEYPEGRESRFKEQEEESNVNKGNSAMSSSQETLPEIQNLDTNTSHTEGHTTTQNDIHTGKARETAKSSYLELYDRSLSDSENITTSSTMRPTDVKKFSSKTLPHKPCCQCSSECITVYDILKESLQVNSQCVTVGGDLNDATGSFCSLIIIANLENLDSFKNYLTTVGQKLSKDVLTVILVLTLQITDKDLKLTDMGILQRSIKELSMNHRAKITVILRSVEEKPGHSLEQENLDRTSTLENTDSPNHKQSSDQRERTSSESRSVSNNLYTDKEKKNSKLSNIVKSLLDQSTDCFHGQVIFLEDS